MNGLTIAEREQAYEFKLRGGFLLFAGSLQEAIEWTEFVYQERHIAEFRNKSEFLKMIQEKNGNGLIVTCHVEEDGTEARIVLWQEDDKQALIEYLKILER